MVGDVAYKLELPEELSRVHNTFHVSNLKKCHADEPLVVRWLDSFLMTTLRLSGTYQDHRPVKLKQLKQSESFSPSLDGNYKRSHEADESCSTIHLSFTTPIRDPTIVTYTSTCTITSTAELDIPEAGTPPRKRLLLTTPRPGSIDTMETRVRDIERRMMATLEVVNTRDADDHAVEHIMHTQALEARARMDTLEDTASNTTTVTEAQLQALINQGVAAAMAEAEASRVRNGDDSNSSGPRPAQTARECSYSEFLKCKPLDFKGTEGVTTTPEAAHAMTWAALKKMMTDKYCPRGEIKKIETEMWNLKVKGTDVVPLSRLSAKLALMCARMFPEEVDKIEKYIGGLPDMILVSVKASKPKTMQEAIEFTTDLMDDKTHPYAERQAERKRKYEGSFP
ncbi:hypothetical protein Tco_1555638 [Tanacetum coccineum]